jgi:hypothetical protein
MRLQCEFNLLINKCKGFILLLNRDNDVIVPMGPSESTNVINPNGYTLNYNEYIVYDTKQVRMRYLVKIKFLFK